MKPVIDLTKEYGLVLEGGGAKGAYQIGAWKALREAGINIKGIAGTSVGALNGALICMDDFENAKNIWESITYSRVMKVDDIRMGELLEGSLPMGDLMKLAIQTMKDGGVDVTPLKELIANSVDPQKILRSDKEFYVLTFSVDERKELEIDMKTQEAELIPDFLLASAYIFPLFKNEKLHGKMFIDGGMVDNVPLDPLLNRGYKDIIVLRIFGVGRERRVKIPEDTTVLSIEPRVDLGNIIEFDADKSRRNMRVGYYDAMRMIYGLSGMIYYIDEELSEQECLFRLCEWKGEILLRKYVEMTLPAVSAELKLGGGWTYRELYLGILEATARMCRVPKYAVYTVEELWEEIKKRKDILKEQDRLPMFIQLILHLQEEDDYYEP